MVNEYHIMAMRLGRPSAELETDCTTMPCSINELLTEYLKDARTSSWSTSSWSSASRLTVTLVLADEISPDTCRFWDTTTHEKLDKDRFRRDLGNVEDAYHEIRKRLMGE